jgi:hypothetical protein
MFVVIKATHMLHGDSLTKKVLGGYTLILGAPPDRDYPLMACCGAYYVSVFKRNGIDFLFTVAIPRSLAVNAAITKNLDGTSGKGSRLHHTFCGMDQLLEWVAVE